ncbi:MAG TPA: sugar-binding protein [Planctomycetota bacterium]|nr:sugar-binding protein [Planctomycetota bacterium]
MNAKNLVLCLVVWLQATGVWAGMVTRRWGKPPTGPPSAKVKTPKAEPPTCYVVETKAAPELDGKLDDEAWKQSPVYHLARSLDGGGDAAQPTEVRLLRDAKTLYLAFRCTEPLVAKLQATRRGHDSGIWDDDSIEFFLGAAGAYYHFGVNAVGSTYDGKAKDASWNSGLKAAVGRETGAWTLEAAVPLAAMVPDGRVPTEWIANFNRNRHCAGTWQESAWSPTFSGDSHVTERFGKMLFKAPPAPEQPGKQPERPVVRKEAVTIGPAEGGEGIVTFDLSDLPKDAKVYRADLLVFRTTPVDGRMDEAMIDIEVFPGGTGVPPVAGKPLALRPPWYDRFDATEAVRAGTASFLVKACPFWNAEATCLDIACEGKPENLPQQVTGVEAFHRAGQTFITWKEIEEPVGRDAIACGEMKRLVDTLDSRRRVRYCVYRHTSPITAGNLHEAELLAMVKPLSGWNLDGRNVDRPVDHFIATNDVLMVGHWNPFGRAEIDGEYGRDCPIERFVIREGDKPLPRGTGLYVRTATKAEKASYAVVTSVDGVQNTAELSKANATTGPLAEAPADPEPVLQGELPTMPFFNYGQKRLHYVQWVAPPMANVPCQYHNWSVGVPNALGKGIPLEVNLHRDGHSYWRTHYRIERDSIVLCPYDFPIKSWWYGYHEAAGTLRSFKQGCIQPYTERRLLAFIGWACRKWPVDRNRMLVTGCRGGASGSGALHLAVRHPNVFSLAIAGHPIMDYAAASRDTSRGGLPLALSMLAVWGKADWGIKTPDGRSFWNEHDLNRAVEALPPTADLPFMTITSSHGYADCRKLYELLLTRHFGVMAEFSWGGARYVPVSNSGTYPNVIRLDIRRDKPFLACVSRQGLALVTEGKMGDFNQQFRWRDVVDTPGRFEATLFLQGRGDAVADAVPRRLQKFKAEKGKAYAWKCGAQTGEATVGDDGLLVLKDVKFTNEGSRLVITAK